MQFCPLISGSSGNAAFLEAAGKRYLIDAGATGKRLSQLLDAIGVSIRTIDAVFVTQRAKFDAVVEEIVRRHQTGQPVLVGTVSVEKSEYVSKLLGRRGVPHVVLNAKFHEK